MLLTIFLTVLNIALRARPAKKQSIYFDGRKNTKAEATRIHKKVLELVEQFPDGQFSKDNPEYYQELIDSVDLSELKDIIKL